MNWSADQYMKFEAERNRPVWDLLAQIPSSTAETAADIGCGPGNSTEILQARFPHAQIKAIDSSVEMIEAAQKRLPNIRFQVAKIQEWTDSGPFDIILANASLHWIPNHDSLLPALIGKLSAGGSLAIQIPDNLGEPVHRIMSEVAATGPWTQKLAQASRAGSNRHSAEWYYGVLRGIADRVDIWRTTYYHALSGAAAITEWFKGTGLRPFLEPLDAIERSVFLDRFEQSIAEVYPPMPDGSVLLPFPRLFMIGTR